MRRRRAVRHVHHVRRAFTLIEIIVVVTIIALLAALIAPRLFGRLTWAKVNAAKTEVKSIATAVEMYINDTGGILRDDFDLDLLLLTPEDGGGLLGPYLYKQEDLIDPWETPFVVRVPGDVNHDFDIISYGPDGQEGTEDDITN